MKLNEEAITVELFQTAKKRIVDSYALGKPPQTPGELVEEIITELEQEVDSDDSIPASKSDEEVFSAAVRSIASGARNWSTYVKAEPELYDLLGDGESYIPACAREAEQEAIIRLLPGLGQTNDAKQIKAWAELLSGEHGKGYYARLYELYEEVVEQGREELGGISTQEAMIVVTAILGHDGGPTKAWKPRTSLRKWSGMGVILGSEFLRNLGWSGFKADRHIIRLLKDWIDEDVTSVHTQRAADLAGLAGRRGAELKKLIRVSLAGIALTPDGMTYSKADNLLWLLGAQVVKTGREGCYDWADYFVRV